MKTLKNKTSVKSTEGGMGRVYSCFFYLRGAISVRREMTTGAVSVDEQVRVECTRLGDKNEGGGGRGR